MIRTMFVSYRWIRSLWGDVCWCWFRLVWSFEHFQNFPLDKKDRDACLMYGRYVASVRGDEFCHRITDSACFPSVTNLLAGLTEPLVSNSSEELNKEYS